MSNLTPQEKELINNFQIMVKKTDNESCWEWLGPKDVHGQGVFHVGGKAFEAHVISWLIFHRYIPKGKQVWHRCSSVSCVNPYHLYLEDDNIKVLYEPKPLPEDFRTLIPGSHEWKDFWKTFPEQQNEMLKFIKELKNAYIPTSHD